MWVGMGVGMGGGWGVQVCGRVGVGVLVFGCLCGHVILQRTACSPPNTHTHTLPYPAVLLPITPATKRLNQKQGVATPPSQLFSAAAGAGKALFPMFDSLATNMMGDNPQLVAHLRYACVCMCVCACHDHDG